MTILTKLLDPASRPNPAPKAESKTYKAVADAIGTLQQYQDIPVRFQKQWVTAFLAVMVLASTLAGLYLNVTSRTAITGREILNLQVEMNQLQRTNADLQTKIAVLQSKETLDTRAKDVGYVPLVLEEIEYVVVPGYFPETGIDMQVQTIQSDDIRMSPEFSESLFGWITRQIEVASLPLAKDH